MASNPHSLTVGELKQELRLYTTDSSLKGKNKTMLARELINYRMKELSGENVRISTQLVKQPSTLSNARDQQPVDRPTNQSANEPATLASARDQQPTLRTVFVPPQRRRIIDSTAIARRAPPAGISLVNLLSPSPPTSPRIVQADVSTAQVLTTPPSFEDNTSASAGVVAPASALIGQSLCHDNQQVLHSSTVSCLERLGCTQMIQDSHQIVLSDAQITNQLAPVELLVDILVKNGENVRAMGLPYNKAVIKLTELVREELPHVELIASELKPLFLAFGIEVHQAEASTELDRAIANSFQTLQSDQQRRGDQQSIPRPTRFMSGFPTDLEIQDVLSRLSGIEFWDLIKIGDSDVQARSHGSVIAREFAEDLVERGVVHFDQEHEIYMLPREAVSPDMDTSISPPLESASSHDLEIQVQRIREAIAYYIRHWEDSLPQIDPSADH